MGSGEGDQSSLPVDYYRSIYYETLDTVMASVTDQFDQEGYSMYRKVESILLQKDISFGAVDESLSLYKDDFSRDLLISQLQLFHSNYIFPSLRWRVSPAHANDLEFSSVRSHELKSKFTSSLHPSIAPPRYKCSITFVKEYL